MHIPTSMRDKLQEWLGLKDLPRTGWVRSGVKEPESVAAHSWGMAILALHFAPKNLDLAKVLAMCIIHDLPEVRVGDLTPHDDVTNKAELEASAMSELAPEWLGLFHEYESAFRRSKFVKQIDKLDMGLQASIYQSRQELDLSEFTNSARSKITDSNLLRFLD